MHKIVLLALVAVPALAFAQTSPSAAPVQKWEYARYIDTLNGSSAKNWFSPQGQINKPDMDGLTDALGCPKSTLPTDVDKLLNCVGEQGWELVGVHDAQLLQFSQRVYIFKRPK